MRIYTIPIVGVSVSAVQDLFSVQATSAGSFWLMEMSLGQITQTSVELLRWTIKKFTGAYAIGSGGSSVTPKKQLTGDAAATVTARINDTTQTSGGTSNTLESDVFNELNGYPYAPGREVRQRFFINEALVVSLDSAPAAARTVSGYIKIGEDF